MFLNNFSKVAKARKLIINANKSKGMFFGVNKYPTHINLNGENIEVVKSYNYLGITIDSKLNFNEQIEKLKNNVNDRLNMLKILLSPKVGCHPQTALNLYKAIIENYILYGISTTGNAAKTTTKKLMTAINTCSRKITGCTKSTPQNTLLALANIPPLKISMEYTTKKEIIKQINIQGVLYQQLKKIENYQGDRKKLSYVEKIYIENQNFMKKVAKQVDNENITFPTIRENFTNTIINKNKQTNK